MEIRIIGYILIALCPAAWGWVISLGLKEELERLEGMIELVERVKYGICERMCTQEELFVGFENSALSKCGFAGELARSRVEGEKSALMCALERFGTLFPTLTECERIIYDFADSLGKLHRSAQAQRCDAVKNRLEEIYVRAREKCAVKMKLYRSMGTLMGVTAVLLLL